MKMKLVLNYSGNKVWNLLERNSLVCHIHINFIVGCMHARYDIDMILKLKTTHKYFLCPYKRQISMYASLHCEEYGHIRTWHLKHR